MTLWTRPRLSNATTTTSWTSEGSKCRTFSWLIKTRSGECPCLPAPFCPGPFLWSGWRSCSPVLWFSPSWHFLGVGKGRETPAGGTPPTTSSAFLTGTPPGNWPELLSLWVQHTDCDPLVGVGHCHPQSPGPSVAVVSQRQRVKPDKTSQDLRVV